MKNSRGRRSWKPPSDSESFASFKAAKETYCNINYQIECLNELYNQLIPQNGIHQRASSSSRAQDGSQRDPKVLQKLRELKANLRSNYGSPRDFPPLERLKVVVMFDDHKKAFFDIRLRPRLGYPTGYPFFIDDNDKGTIVGISEAIFQEVLKAVQEEEEERDFGEGYNNNNNSHAAEDWQEPVNIKQEVYEDEELITLEDDIDEERYSDELQQEERYNSQAISPPPASENSDLSEDFTGSANLGLVASASSSSSATVPPENGLAASPQATDTDNSSSSNNTAEQEQRQTSVSSSGSTVNRRQSETLGLPIKLEPAGCSIATFTRVARPPKRAHRMAPEEAPAAAAATSVAVPPPPAASNIRVIQVNPRATNTNTNTNMFQSQSKPQQQQQLPPAGALTIEPTENSSVYLILNNNNNNKRPAGNSNAAQPSPSHAHSQGNPKRSKVSAAAAAAATAGTSTFSSSTQAARATSQAVAEHFLASAAFVEAPKAKKLDCPLCRKAFVKAAMSDHLEMEHTNRGHYVPYRCNYPGCQFTNLYRVNVLRHVQRKHGSRNAKQYIVKPAAEVVVPTARTAESSSLVSRSSAAASAKRRAAAAAATAASTASKPSTARTSLRQRQQQKQQKQQQRPSTSASTTSTSQGVLSAEDYLRANCPEYAAAGNSRTRVKCPDCPMTKTKYELKDHYLAKHRGLKPYRCQWPGCSYTSGWQTSAARHVKDVHKDSSYAQYIEYREEE